MTQHMLCQNVVPSELEQHPDQHLQKVPQMLCKHEMLFHNVDQKDLNNISINFLCQKVDLKKLYFRPKLIYLELAL